MTRAARAPLRALTWNLFHGRDHPPGPGLGSWRSRILRRPELGETHAQVNRPLLAAFTDVLDAMPWEVALLQEAPPRWLEPLGRGCRASGALSLTSRNTLPRLRAAIARRNPDLIASNEGGSNVVLVRAPGAIGDVMRVTLARRPERRTLLLCRVSLPSGERLAVACTHLSVASTGRTPGELLRAAATAAEFAAGEPLLFGGDLNLRPAHEAATFDALARVHGLAPPTAPRAIDHLLADGLDVLEPPHALPDAARELTAPRGLRVRLSDHAPVAATFGMR